MILNYFTVEGEYEYKNREFRPLGLIMGMIRELGIMEVIDKEIALKNESKKITYSTMPPYFQTDF